jgi:anti-sigma regulatory factor (Ser/Thr protein kinase)
MTDMSMLKIHARFSPDPGAAADARRSLEPLRRLVAPGKFEDATLLVSELITNSIRHGGLKRGQWLDLNVGFVDETLRVEVADPGQGFSAETERQSLQGGTGWGLFLLDHIATKWGISREPVTTAWFELNCEEPAYKSREPAVAR